MSRTKNYLCVLTMLFSSGILFSRDITQDATLHIEDLNASSIGLYDGGTGNQILLLTPDYTGISNAQPILWSEGLNIQCYNENGSGTSEYRAATFMNDQTNYQAVYYPYLQVEAEPGTTITHIAFKGYNVTNNTTAMTYGFSTSRGLDLTDADFDVLYYDLIPGILTLPDAPLHINRGAANACVVCSTETGIEKLPVPEGCRSIRVAARTDFPATAATEFIKPVQPFHLLGIYIWTDQGIPSPVSSPEETIIGNYMQDGWLFFDQEMAVIGIYSPSGMLLTQVENTSQISLSLFPAGIYLAKATTKTGRQSVYKVYR